jgi:predicted DNA-binding protein YlxM (UPF0122 family)
MKTIKQIADELGVNKQRVYRYIKRNRIIEAHQEQGVMWYDDAVESSIIKHFTENVSHHEAYHTTSHDAIITMLQRELEIKNQQIEKLTVALENTTSSLQAAQALHAGTLQGTKLLVSGEDAGKPGLRERWRNFWKKATDE